jgi:hypothetical protein
MKPTVRSLLAKVKAGTPAPAATQTKTPTQTKANPNRPGTVRRTPSPREVFGTPHVTTGELTGSRGYSC